MKIITASRLSEGNKIFPAEIHIEENGLTVKIPGFLGGKSTFLSYSDISSVSVDAPMIGFSTIRFNAHGEKVTSHGFTKSEVNEIKTAIDNGKRNAPVNTNNNSGFATGANASDGNNSGGGFLNFLSKQKESLDNSYEADIQREKEEKEKIEGKIENIAQISFGSNAEEISNQLSQLVAIGNAKPDKNVKAAIIEKMEFGIMKLKGMGSNTEADFFEKKLEPLKKKSWF